MSISFCINPKWIIFFVVIGVLNCYAQDEQSAVRGRVVDLVGNPVSKVKIIASRIYPIEGYEQLTTISQRDGTFILKGLLPGEFYELKLHSDNWILKTEVTVNAELPGKTAIMQEALVIYRTELKHEVSAILEKKHEINQLDTIISELDAEIEKGLAMVEQLDSYRRQVGLLREEMRETAKALGDKPEIDELVRKIEALAKQCGLRIERLHPVPERSHGFYGEMPISINVFGGYHNLADFFDRVGNEKRIMNVTDLQVREIYRRGGPSISAEYYLTFYYYLQ